MTIDCPHCGAVGVAPRLSHQPPHIRADCTHCGRWVRWVKATPESRADADKNGHPIVDQLDMFGGKAAP